MWEIRGWGAPSLWWKSGCLGQILWILALESWSKHSGLPWLLLPIDTGLWCVMWGLTQTRSHPQAADPQSVFFLNTRNSGWNDVPSAAFWHVVLPTLTQNQNILKKRQSNRWELPPVLKQTKIPGDWSSTYRRQAEDLISCLHIMFSPKETFYLGKVAPPDNLGSLLVLTGFQNHWWPLVLVPRPGSGRFRHWQSRSRAAAPPSPSLFPHGSLPAGKFGSGILFFGKRNGSELR